MAETNLVVVQKSEVNIGIKGVTAKDNIYMSNEATCVHIREYVYSKGAVNGGLINKFCNLEILTDGVMFYLIKTYGDIGGKKALAQVKRYTSDLYARKWYQKECDSLEDEGYKRVVLVNLSVYCTVASEKFLLERYIPEKNVAKASAKEVKQRNTDIVNRVKKPVIKRTNTLNPAVSEFVKSIYNEAGAVMRASLNPAAFNGLNGMTGVLSLDTIKRGQKILEEISKIQRAIQSNSIDARVGAQKIVNLSNEYNSTIPRALSSNNTDWLLDSGDKLLMQYDLLDMLMLSLSNAVIGNKTDDSNIVNAYEALNCDIKLVTDDKLIKEIQDKMRTEQLWNHHFKTKVRRVFEVNQKKAPPFLMSGNNIASLWHGTGASNLVSILSTHLKLRRNIGIDVHLTGAMFGDGIYFGEYSKALQYATSTFSGKNNVGNSYYIFLCDVNLGTIKCETHAKAYSRAPSGYDSVMGVGSDALKKGCNIKGLLGNKDLVISADTLRRQVKHSSSSLLHNEFIIYSQNKVRIRYVVEVVSG